MPGKIDKAGVLHVAKLASLSLEEDEVLAMALELSRIVDHVAELEQIDTTDVPPTTSMSKDGADALRPDEPKPGLSHEDALAGAPETSSGGFAVPIFLDAPARERTRR
jgi:aspartyl-tRNA(Asn)/glutamyl-tRNA(Gln) amidotransferase subunit C